MSLLQSNNPCLPIQYCVTSIRTVGTNGASAAIREGQPADRWGNTVQTTPSARGKYTNTPPSVRLQAMIVFLWEALTIRRQNWNLPVQSAAVIKFRAEREKKKTHLLSVLLQQKTLVAILGRETLIRPLLITVIGHRASQECEWPIAVNLLSPPPPSPPLTIKTLLGIFSKTSPVENLFWVHARSWLNSCLFIHARWIIPRECSETRIHFKRKHLV